jgi:lysophospholipase L1-like esterase
MSRVLLALGDSISCGEGVGVQLERGETWVGRLAAALGYELDLQARPGARVGDVRREQLVAAQGSDAGLVTVLVGLNDVIRGGFDAAAVQADLAALATELRAPGRTVLLMRLYDPTALLPLPRRLRLHLIGRVRAINAALDSAQGDGVWVVDLARIGALRRRGAWAVDRLHPGPAGHLAITAACADFLGERGFELCAAPARPLVPPGPTRRAEGRWLVRHGMPWLARHLREVGAPLTAAIVGRGG